MVNEELLRRVMKQIESTPADWDQDDWFRITPCGTVACFAGWTLILTGRVDERGQLLDEQGELLPCRFSMYDEFANHPAGCQCSIMEVATELLGLTDRQAEDIFFYKPAPGNPIEQQVAWMKYRISLVTGMEFH